MLKPPAIFSGNANISLVESICRYVNLPRGRAKVARFADGENYVEIEENVRGVNCFVVQPTSTPVNDNLMELLIIIDALKRASAGSIVAILPYFGYARQDRKVKPRTPISAKLVADLITAAGATRILAVDLHAGQIQGFFNIPFDHIYAMPVMMEYLREHYAENTVVVSPDAGGVERARAYSKRLGGTLAIIDKRRPTANVSQVMNLVGEVRHKDAVIIDDIIDTGGTLVATAQAIMEHGAHSVSACATHGVFSGDAVVRIMDSPIKEVIVTDTIALPEVAQQCPKIKVMPVGRLLGEAIKRIHNGDSISSLFI